MAKCRSWRKLPFSGRQNCLREKGHDGQHAAVGESADALDHWGDSVEGKVLDLMAALKNALDPKRGDTPRRAAAGDSGR